MYILKLTDQVNQIEQNCFHSNIIANLLSRFNFINDEFLSYTYAPSPLMKNIDCAANVLTSLNSTDNILIYGDYDVDGITSTTLLYRILRLMGLTTDYYIPSRTSGYGISIDSLTELNIDAYNVVISVDNGIKATDTAKHLQNKNIRYIVLDHHNPGETLPDALIVNPKQNDCPFFYKDIAAVAVVWELYQYLCSQNVLTMNESWIWLPALGTIADVMPLSSTYNRHMVYHGINAMNTIPDIAIQAFMNELNITEIDVQTIGFYLSPMINAASRMDNIQPAIDLMLAEDNESAQIAIKQLAKLNRTRRKVQKDEYDSISISLNNLTNGIVCKTISPNLTGISGLVASSIVERTNLPAIVLSKKDHEIYSGSIRSTQDFHTDAIFEKTSHLLKGFGGHDAAGGLSLHQDNVNDFLKVVNSIEYIPSDTPDIIYAHAEISLHDVGDGLYNDLKSIAPFGNGFEPVFITRQVTVTDTQRFGDSHIKIVVSDGRGNFIECVGFRMARHYDNIRFSETIDIAYTIGYDQYRGYNLLLRGFDSPYIRKVNASKSMLTGSRRRV